MPETSSYLDHQRGALLGMAVGDALGAAVEFKSPGSFKPVTGYRAGGPHGLTPGAWTDDTSMALALADPLPLALRLRAPSRPPQTSVLPLWSLCPLC